jgi:hypothetical protein
MITTTHSELKPTAADFTIAINKVPEEIGLTDTLRKFVEEAIFTFGVVKVGLATTRKIAGQDYGEVFVDLVTADNYFIDMSAKCEADKTYEGNQYWMDYEDFKASGWLSEEDLKNAKPDEPTAIGPSGEPRAEGIGTDRSIKEYREKKWLRDVWLPHEGVILTIGVANKRVYRTVKWKGPKEGPYIKLGYTDVPGNLLPLPPVSLWRDLHELSNTLFRKIAKDAEAFKSVMGFSGGHDESVQNFKNAKSGDGIKYNGPEPVDLKAGGVDAKSLAFYIQCKDLFSYFANNMDTLGGLGNIAPTLGQDKLLGEAASAQVKDMVDKTIDAVKKIFKAIAFYEWNDPVKTRRLEQPIPGSKQSIAFEWNRDSRKGDISMYDLAIDIYSLQDNTPSIKLQKLGVILQTYILPLLPMIQQAGGQIDAEKIIELVALYSDFPELKEVVTFSEFSSPSAGAGAGNGPAPPAVTNRTYTRVGQPGQSRQGADAVMQQSLLSNDGEE